MWEKYTPVRSMLSLLKMFYAVSMCRVWILLPCKLLPLIFTNFSHEQSINSMNSSFALSKVESSSVTCHECHVFRVSNPHDHRTTKSTSEKPSSSFTLILFSPIELKKNITLRKKLRGKNYIESDKPIRITMGTIHYLRFAT
jgi:hypothetical protein